MIPDQSNITHPTTSTGLDQHHSSTNYHNDYILQKRYETKILANIIKIRSAFRPKDASVQGRGANGAATKTIAIQAVEAESVKTQANHSNRVGHGQQQGREAFTIFNLLIPDHSTSNLNKYLINTTHQQPHDN